LRRRRFFGEIAHSTWLRKYLGREDVPEMRLYTLGNPLIAQTMMRHDVLAGLYVPPRVAVVADGEGTLVVFDLPSALIAVGDCKPALKEAVQELDRKLEALVREVTGLDSS
jgi:uncharacterized protein (DUF302 family)